MKPEIHQEKGYRLMGAASLAPEHEAQLINTLRLTRSPVGYLLNFGHKDTLEWRRFILSEHIPSRLDQRRLA